MNDRTGSWRLCHVLVAFILGVLLGSVVARVLDLPNGRTLLVLAVASVAAVEWFAATIRAHLPDREDRTG